MAPVGDFLDFGMLEFLKNILKNIISYIIIYKHLQKGAK